MLLAPPVPLEIEQMLRSELNPNERLIWCGQPISGRTAIASLPVVLFGIPWTLISIFWVVSTMGMGRLVSSAVGPSPFNMASSVFSLLGIPFVLIGLVMLSSPFWMQVKAQKPSMP